MRQVIVIGGGVAGLGAAYKVRRAADAGHDVAFTLLEKDDRLGGKLSTVYVDDPKTGGRFVVDGGSDSFLTDKPAVHRVAKMLGILEDETPTCDENKKTFIVKAGRLVEMPDGIMMFAPTKVMPMVTTALYSWPAKLRMGMDLFVPKRRVPQGERNDETLESFVVRRMGRECLERLAEPLVGGVNGSDPKDMSLAATYPMLLDMEQEYGSLVRGLLAQRKKVEEMRRKYPPRPGAKQRTFFTSFAEGLQFLSDSMADAAGRADMRTGVPVTGIQPSADGAGWRVVLADGGVLSGDAVVVATEAWAAAPLITAVDERTSDLVGQIPCSSSATIALAYREEECPFDKNWHGILAPAVEGMSLTGVSLMSSKWPGRAPEGRVLLRGFVGGSRDQAVLERTDAEIALVAREQLAALLGISLDAEPLFTRVFRWPGGMPQYTMGHLDRVDEIEDRTSRIAGFALAGGAYRGVGVPNCLDSGERAAAKVLADLGIDFTEEAAAPPRLY